MADAVGRRASSRTSRGLRRSRPSCPSLRGRTSRPCLHYNSPLSRWSLWVWQSRSGYVLVPRLDVLQLDACGAVELDGVLHVLAPLPHQLDLRAGLLEDLTHGCVVGKFTLFYMAARW